MILTFKILEQEINDLGPVFPLLISRVQHLEISYLTILEYTNWIEKASNLLGLKKLSEDKSNYLTNTITKIERDLEKAIIL